MDFHATSTCIYGHIQEELDSMHAMHPVVINAHAKLLTKAALTVVGHWDLRKIRNIIRWYCWQESTPGNWFEYDHNELLRSIVSPIVHTLVAKAGKKVGSGDFEVSSLPATFSRDMFRHRNKEHNSLKDDNFYNRKLLPRSILPS